MHYWSEKELDWLRVNYKKHTISELVPKFNDHFNVDITFDKIKGALARYKIHSGRTGKFKKGQKAWNEGMKGLDLAGENGKKTQFKKGQAPTNYRPVGSERIDSKDGYVMIKVSDKGRYQDRWKLKHRIVWEKEYGSIPDNHTVIFADGDKYNFDLDNLILINRKQLLYMNQNQLIKHDAELTRTGVIITDLHYKTQELEK